MTRSHPLGRRLALAIAPGLIALSMFGVAVATAMPARAGVDDFSFDSMNVEYQLDTSALGESLLTTHERLVALFPDSDQNHGIQRAIPLDYQGHATHPTVASVTNADGQDVAYSTEEVDGFLLVTIRDENFVHGRVEYAITYTQSNVILTPDDGGGIQEFYWDVNGTGWAQPFGSVTARVVVSPELVKHLTDSSSCYQGGQGASTPCAAATSNPSPDGGKVFEFSASNLAAFETLTIAMGFAPDTFVIPDTSLWAHPLGVIFAILTGVMCLLFVGALLMRVLVWRNARGRGIVIAQYEAPEGMAPVMAANLVGRSARALVAALLRLAVLGKLVIRDEKPGARRGSEFELSVVSMRDLGDEDRRVLEAAYGPGLVVGSTITTSSADTSRSRRVRQLIKATKRLAVEAGYRSAPHARARRVAMIAALAVGVIVFFVGGAIVVDGFGGVTTVLITYFATFAVTVTTLALLASVAPLTVAGAQAREHLRGLKLFIRLAEADRVAFLQSPTGAERRPDFTKSREVIHLYEKTLPYAVLFGLEKQWSKELAALYERESVVPTWYTSQDPFLAATFVVSMNALSSSAATWAASGSYSSSSGSSGGGFAGGGGGGGGGGGV